LQASDVDRFGGERPAERQGNGKRAFHVGNDITVMPTALLRFAQSNT
jgi:hypothetical protein